MFGQILINTSSEDLASHVSQTLKRDLGVINHCLLTWCLKKCPAKYNSCFEPRQQHIFLPTANIFQMGQVPVLLSYNEKVWTPPFRAALPTYSISWSPTKFARSDQMRKMRMKKNSKHYITCQRGHRLISFLAFKQSNHICWEIIFLGQKTFKNEKISGHSWIFTKSGQVKWWSFTIVFYDEVKNPALIYNLCDLNRWNLNI